MVKNAFVVLNTDVGEEQNVVNMLRGQPNIERADLVYGVYDIICFVKGETMDELKSIITEKIRKIDAVRNTLTMILTDE